MKMFFFSLALGFALTGCASHSSETTLEAPTFVPDPSFKIVTAEEWGSEPDSLAGREHTPRYVTIHHAGTEWKAGTDPVDKLKGLQSWGKRDKEWPDVPYHYLISPDGVIYEGRSTDYEPETNTSFDTDGHLNVHLWGNFEVQRVTKEQLESSVYISAYLFDKFDISPDTLGGHMDRLSDGGTSCPGKDLIRYIHDGTYRGWVDEYLEGNAPTIILKEELVDGPSVFISQ